MAPQVGNGTAGEGIEANKPLDPNWGTGKSKAAALAAAADSAATSSAAGAVRPTLCFSLTHCGPAATLTGGWSAWPTIAAMPDGWPPYWNRSMIRGGGGGGQPCTTAQAWARDALRLSVAPTSHSCDPETATLAELAEKHCVRGCILQTRRCKQSSAGLAAAAAEWGDAVQCPAAVPEPPAHADLAGDGMRARILPNEAGQGRGTGLAVNSRVQQAAAAAAATTTNVTAAGLGQQEAGVELLIQRGGRAQA